MTVGRKGFPEGQGMDAARLEREAAAGIGGTVAAELARRGDCRHGLRGVKVEHEGRPWLADCSEWMPDGSLVLDLVPEEKAAEHFEDEGKGFEWKPMSAAELFALPPRPGWIKRVRASEAVLRSPWPVPCPCWLDE